MKIQILSSLAVGFALSATALAEQSSGDQKSASVASQAISGVTYMPPAPTAAPVVAPATSSIMSVPDIDTSATVATPMPAYHVQDQKQRVQRDVDHQIKVVKWLDNTKPAAKTVSVGKNAILGIFAEPQEGANGKVEVPFVDLEY
jgi:hypothetical protein